MNNITHFEIPADNIERAHKFYSELFDWDFNKMEEMDYLMIQTKNPDGSNGTTGGIFARQAPQQPVTNYVNVDNIDESAAKIQELGGKIVVPKSPVPNMGWLVHFTDSEGNLMALWQVDSEAK